MSNPNEKTFQEILIDFFKSNLNYQYKKNGDLFEENLRENERDFLLKPILKRALQKINSDKTTDQIEKAIFEIEKIDETNLVLANKKFYQLITSGIDTYNEETKQYQKIFLFDFEKSDNNDFLIVDEFKFKGNKKKRLDLVVFLNGIPISIIELKNPLAEEVTIDKAYDQIKTYQENIKDLFLTNCFNSISNHLNNGVGTITSNLERYTEFKDETGNGSFENHFRGLYQKENLLKIIKYYLIFTREGHKIIASYHQFFCTEKIIQKSILVNEKKESQVGVVWHTTGSGKSFTMVFYTKQLLQKLKPLLIILTDRIDLDNQLFRTFSNCQEYLKVQENLKQITSRQDLIECLKNNKKSEIVFTTIQKFLKDEQKSKFEELSQREDIFIIVDEAHRSQYDTAEGLARHIRDALPRAKFLAFSGTPIELEKKNTKLIFGDYIDKYLMSRAVKDKTTVPISYEPRLAKIGFKREMIAKLDAKATELFAKTEITEKPKKEFLKMETVIGDEKRLKIIARDFIEHYQMRANHIFGKVMFCCFSRKVAVTFYEILQRDKPDWFSDDDKKGKVKLIFSGSASDQLDFQKHIRTKKELEAIEKRFKNEEDDLKIIIVVDMWLTGFDVPCLHTLYVDKPLQHHNLIQAISRVNRVYPGKESGGLVVDYIGIGYFLEKALAHFSDEDRVEIKIDFASVIEKMVEKYELSKSYFKDFAYRDFFKTDDKKRRLEIVRDGVNHILKNEKDRKNYLLNSLELLKAYSLCPLSDEAKERIDEINFFKWVRTGILQLEHTSKTISEKINLDLELSKLVSSSIETKGVIDVYDFVGIKKPQIEILSEDFFNEAKNIRQKHLAYELLKKVLNDKIKITTKGNLVLEKKFSEKLRDLVRRYQNRTIESAEIIEEFFELSKEISQNIEDKKKLGLNRDEVAFYDAVSQINNKEEIMKIEVLKELAKELVFKIRENKTIDWHKRETTRAKMRLVIKRLLTKYKYPPKGLERARELVIKQAEIFCEEME